MKPLRFHSRARAEFDAAAHYYERQRPGLGGEFRAELEEGLRRIRDTPKSFPESSRPGYRRYLVARFPYSIFFAEFDEFIWIAAVSHHSRSPAYWYRRKLP